MLRKASDLRQYSIEATDGSIGSVHDHYFDDRFWTLRYIVVDTGNWLPGRKVLIAPEAIIRTDSEGKSLSLNLSKQQIENSPDIGSDLPVSRQMEIEMRQRFGWAEHQDVAAAGVVAPPLIPPFVPKAELQEVDPSIPTDSDPNLRSALEIDGYGISAKDDEIGSVDDLLIDDKEWVIRYLVIGTGIWLLGRKVLIAPRWCQGISWAHRVLDVAVPRESIETCPEYDPVMPVSREYEAVIHRHYQRDGYWS